MTSTTSTLVNEIEALTAQDRCDRCGAAAKVRAITTLGEFLFCGHCGNKHLPALQATGFVVTLHDEREFAVN
jgi:hypothetical protein